MSLKLDRFSNLIIVLSPMTTVTFSAANLEALREEEETMMATDSEVNVVKLLCSFNSIYA